MDVTCSLDTAANKVCGCVTQLSPFVVAVPAATQVLQAALTVKPLPLNLATSLKRFTCLIDLPTGYSEAQISQGSLQLSLPGCPECGVSSSPAGTPQGDQYAAKFKRAFLRKVSPGNVDIKVAGQLQDGTPFEGAAAVQTWKPLTLSDLHTENAKGQAETQFGRNEPIVLIGSYAIDPKAGKGLKASLLVKAFGQSFKSPWKPVAAGQNQVGYSVLVPGTAALGSQTLKATLRLRKDGQLYDTVGLRLPIEVLEQPKLE